MNEEITARMTMDTEPFSRAINKARSGIADFSDNASAKFDKSATSARALRGVLGEIGSISPMIGVALTAAFSAPMAGLELLKMGIGAIKEGLEASKRAAKEAGEAFEKLLKLTGDPRDRLRNSEGDPYAEGVESRKTGVKVRSESLEQDREKERKLREEAMDAQAELAHMNPEDARYMSPLSLKALEDTVKEYDELTKRIREQDAALSKRKDTLSESEKFEKRAAEEADKTIKKKKEAAEEEDKLHKSDLKLQKDLDSIKRESEKRDEQATIKAIQEASIRERIAEHFMAPFRPSMSELSKSKGKGGDLARRIQGVEAFGKQANMAGRTDLVAAAQRELYGYDYDPDASRAAGGVAQRDINGNTMPKTAHQAGLMDRLRDTGIMAPDTAMQSMQKSLDLLLTRAAGQGLNVNIVDIRE